MHHPTPQRQFQFATRLHLGQHQVENGKCNDDALQLHWWLVGRPEQHHTIGVTLRDERSDQWIEMRIQVDEDELGWTADGAECGLNRWRIVRGKGYDRCGQDIVQATSDMGERRQGLIVANQQQRLNVEMENGQLEELQELSEQHFAKV